MFARTERLLLRPGWIEDAPALHAAIADEALVRNLAQAPWPYTRLDAERYLMRERRPTEASSLIFLRTEEAPQLIGGIGFARTPAGEMELGYWIARPHWGRGYASEAGRALLDYARESLRIPRLGAGHFIDNPASGRVLEKLGFRPLGRIALRHSAGRGEAVPCRLFEIELAAAEEDTSRAIAA
ncbi:MAG TPA: GNAT family N-acetyltransferase [Allosphingosinicella sp.]|jgi:RimJ/RimL family protein N-acetyltransferase|nr:GNAT family N-acetyltransferase [Allosphingosinicella sp.]